MKLANLHSLDFSTEPISLVYALAPKPFCDIISSLWLGRLYISLISFNIPNSINLSSVFSLNPTIFIAFLEQ